MATLRGAIAREFAPGVQLKKFIRGQVWRRGRTESRYWIDSVTANFVYVRLIRADGTPSTAAMNKTHIWAQSELTHRIR